MLKEANEILAGATDDSILVDRLDGAIRALAPAVIADNCVSEHARELLMTLLSVQRRVLLTHDDNYVRRGSTLISARALLTLATQNDDELLYAHIDAYAEGSTLLSTLLRALSAAAEETPSRATAALRVWPKVVSRVLELSDLDRIPSQGRHYRDMELAVLIPNITRDFAYMYREIENEPISWWEPLELQSAVEAWLVPAAGNPQCADQLIRFIGKLTPENQARIGLPWVAELVLADPDHIARYFCVQAVVDWLIEVRTAVADADLQALRQQVVDDLVVAGVSQFAPYSD